MGLSEGVAETLSDARGSRRGGEREGTGTSVKSLSEAALSTCPMF
jgi:hypothetical protein